MALQRLWICMICLSALLLPAALTAAQKGYLQVNVSVPAKVYVDGRYKGESSPASVLNIGEGFAVGSVEVRVEAEGYKTVSRRYTILPNQWTQAVFYLERDTPAAAPPAPPPSIPIGRATPPEVDLVAEKLRTCRAHFAANRLTTPAGRNAADCFNDVLRLDPANRAALAGLVDIEKRYAAWTRSVLARGELDKARSYLSRLESVNPANPEVIELAAAIDQAASRAEAEAKTEPEPRAPARERPPAEIVQTDSPAAGAAFPTAPDMVAISGGCFDMGSPESEPERDRDERLHRVCLEDFAMARSEVTVGDFRRFVDDTGYRTEAELDAPPAFGCFSEDTDGSWRYVKGRSWRDPGFGQEDEHPVACVSWRDALAYIEWLNGKTGQRFRLPTEAEWEYAARAGDGGMNPWRGAGDAACVFGSVADERAYELYKGLMTHECEDGFIQTAPVGRFQANAFGLFDTMANVSEWTCSYYGADYSGAETQCARSTKGGLRVNRGAAWNTIPAWARYATRMRLRPGGRADSLGFRLARDMETTR